VWHKPGNSAEAPEASPALAFRDNIELADTHYLYVWYIVFSDSAEALWKTVQKGCTAASSEKLDEDQKKRMDNVEKASNGYAMLLCFWACLLEQSSYVSSDRAGLWPIDVSCQGIPATTGILHARTAIHFPYLS
jgi:hypothetical protein